MSRSCRLLAVIAVALIGIAVTSRGTPVSSYTRTLSTGGGYVNANDVAIDSDGYVYLTGSTTGPIGGTNSYGSERVFLAKYTAGGINCYGLVSLLSSESSVGTSVGVSSADKVYVAGYGYEHSALYYLPTLEGYNTDGKNIFHTSLSATAATKAYCLAVGDANSIYVVGTTYGGAVEGQTNVGSSDAFIAKFTAAGVKSWASQWGSTNADEATGVAAFGNDLYVVGTTCGAFDGQTNSGITTDLSDAFLTKYNAQGVRQWSRIWGGTNWQMAYSAKAVTVDTNGSIYVVGSLDRRSYEGANPFNTVAFIAKFNSAGVEQWMKFWGTDGEGPTYTWENFRDVTVAPGNTVCVNGNYHRSTPGTGKHDYAGVFYQFDANGNALYMGSYETNSTYTPTPGGIAVNNNGSVYLAGSQPRSSADLNYSAFLKKYRTGANKAALFNNYGGTQKTDLSIYYQGYWFGAELLNGAISSTPLWNLYWGWPGAEVVPGDYNGDGIYDMAVYDQASGSWYIMLQPSQTILTWGKAWGWTGAVTVPGDYDGDGASDLAVYDTNTGYWYIWSLEHGALAWQMPWGWPGAVTVPGDFDGDEKSDLAVFDNASGAWYIKSLSGSVLLWGFPWGWSGVSTVPGDYDGDGASDMAIYDATTRLWFVCSLAAGNIVYGKDWGSPGYMPVTGDFDGDGKSDIAIYELATGKWFVMSPSSNTVIAFDLSWGWPGAIPVGGRE